MSKYLRWSLLLVVAVGLTVLWKMLPPPQADLDRMLKSPDLYHWLGTDTLGRDMLYRTLLAVSYTLGQSAIILMSSAVAGLLAATLSAWSFGQWADRMIVLSAETLRAYPTLLLVLLFALVGAPATLLLIVYFWIPVWRVLRPELVAQQRQPYALVAQLVGMSKFRVLVQEVMPNVFPRVAPYAAGLLAEVISAQCALEFLGFGPPLERASLGGVLLESTRLGLAAPWIWAPSLFVTIASVWTIASTARKYRKEIRWIQIG